MVSVAKKGFLIKYSIIFFFERGMSNASILKKKGLANVLYDFLDIGVIAIVVQLQQKMISQKRIEQTVINCILYNMKYL